MPIYNDWDSCVKVIEALDHTLSSNRIGEANSRRYTVILVDDGSDEMFEINPGRTLQVIDSVDVLRLKRNLGHQRAICIGLTYAQQHLPCQAVILMDSDGEDDPEDVPRLLAKFDESNHRKIVFARRVKRSEYWIFRIFLQMYKGLHRLFTGRGIYVGNFSVIPYRLLDSLVSVPEMWSHYAASVMHARLPYSMVSSNRAERLDGKSKMNFTSLVMHGLSAISVYSEIVGIRLLIASLTCIGLVALGLVGVFAFQTVSANPLSGWPAITIGLFMVILLQIVMFAMSFSFLVLSGRKNAGFIPIRDYHFFVDRFDNLWKKEANPTST